MIDDVKVKDLKFIEDQRGRLIEILRSDDQLFKKFGQVYMTTAYPGIIKAWHGHKIQTDHIACIRGTVKLVIFDGREGSKTYHEFLEFEIGDKNPKLIQIPPLVWHGFKNIGPEEALVINVPTETYNHDNPDELRKPLSEFPYDWEANNV